jgi:hypothetical protein
MFFWLRATIFVVAVVLTTLRSGANGLTEEGLHWWLGGIALLHLSNVVEAMYNRWLLRAEVKAYLSMDPAERSEQLDRLWLSVARNYLRERLEGEAEVEVSGPVERYPFPHMDRHFTSRVFWGIAVLGVAVVAPATGLFASPPWWPYLAIPTLAVSIVALFVLRRWERHLATTLELSPFGLAEVHPNGDRRSIPFNQPLVLQNRPWRRRLELRPATSSEYIAIDYGRVAVLRLVKLLSEYAGFSPRSA